MKQKSFLLIFLCLVLTICSFGQVRKTLENKITVKTTDASPKKQTLLTNSAQFTGKRALNGGSGFLIKYNNSNYAVTARHLLGEDGGVVPEVKINALAKNLLNWEMSPRVVMNPARETVKLNANGLNFSKSLRDIVLLNVASDAFDLEVLTPNFVLPAEGETLFLIGCPYSESQCRQNSYAVKFVEYDAAEATLVCEITSKVDLSGFSGAPLINGTGEVVGVLISGGESDGKNYIMATHIKEIQKIK